MHFVFTKGLLYADTSGHYGYLYETIMSIARAFEENSQVVPKHEGGVRYPILRDEHIQWLIKRLHVNLDITIESLHC